MIRSKNKQLGFTLIELLTVISVVGMVSSMITAVVSETRLETKHSRRVADLKQIMNAMELYYSDNGSYPCQAVTMRSDDPNFLYQLVDAGYIARAPEDPINTNPFVYWYISYHYPGVDSACGQIYELDMTLENPSDSCPLSGIEVSPEHCHIFYPTSLPCSSPYISFGVPDCEALRG